MGGSGCNADPNVAYEFWEQEDFRIVESALRGLVVMSLLVFARFGVWSSFHVLEEKMVLFHPEVVSRILGCAMLFLVICLPFCPKMGPFRWIDGFSWGFLQIS